MSFEFTLRPRTTERERSVIILTKQRPTPRAYPRKAGTVEKKPL